MLDWLSQRKWEKSKSPTAGELRVIRQILTGDDPRLQKLMQQVEKADRVQRQLIGNNGYKMTIPWTTEDLLIPLDDNIESSAINVRDPGSNQILEFKLFLLRGGFFGGLIGRSLEDKDWPRDWSVDEDYGIRKQEPGTALKLPPTDTEHLPVLLNWLDIPATMQSEVILFPPASHKDLQDLQSQELFQLPEEYKEFLLISNGLDVRKFQILGTKDAYRLDLPTGEVSLLILSLNENGAVLLLPTGEVIVSLPSMKRSTKESSIAPTFRNFLRKLVLGEISL